MKKVVVTIYGKTYADMADACEHAASQLRMETPSENCAWEDGSRVDYTVQKDALAEYQEIYGDDYEEHA